MSGGSRYGALFWSSLAIGGGAITFGVVTAISHAGSARPVALALYMGGAVAAHDLVAVPAVLVFGRVVGPRLPPGVRGPVLGGAIATALVALVAVPPLVGSRLADNASLLPRNYAAGLFLVIAGVWIVTGLVVAVSVRRSRDGEEDVG